MRWPWEWGRRADVTEAGAGEAGDTSRGPAGGSARAAALPATPSSPGAWISLPPVQRSLADTAPSVAPPDAFRTSLTTQQNPGFLAPLGHMVDRDGPSGVVGGLASSVAEPIPYEGSVELRVPDRPAEKDAPALQRRVAELRPGPGPSAVSDDHSPSRTSVDESPAESPRVEPASLETPTVEAPSVLSPTVETPTVAMPTEETPFVDSPLVAESPVTSRPTEPAASAGAGRADAVTPRPPDQPAREPLVVARQVESSAGSSTARASGAPTAPSMTNPATVQCLAEDHTGHDHQSTGQPTVEHHPLDQQPPDLQSPDQAPHGRSAAGQSAADRSDPSIPSIVQRSSSADAPPSPANSAAQQTAAAPPEVATPILGSRPEAVTAVDSPVSAAAAPSTRTTESMPPLVVPVQRTTSTIPGASLPPIGTDPPPILAVETTGPTGAGNVAPPVQRLAAEPGPSQHPASGPEFAQDVSVEAATAAEPSASLETARAFDASTVPGGGEAATEPTAPPTTGLLADHPPLIDTTDPTTPGDEPGEMAPEDPLIVPSHRGNEGNSVQRLATAQPRPLGTQQFESRPLESQTFQGPATPAEPTVRGLAGVPDGGSGGPFGTAGGLAGAPDGGSGGPFGTAGDHAEYPPLVARSVQRRTADAESGRAADPQAPLSGFAAAISALGGDAPVQRSTSADLPATDRVAEVGSPDLVVARQVTATPSRTGAASATGRHAGVALSSASSFDAPPPARAMPELVVARRIAPDGGGNLPAADVRLSAPGSLSGGPDSSIDDPSTIVQRSLIADQPPLVPHEPSPGQAAAGSSAPAVQRIQYEDLAAAPTDRFPSDAATGRAGTASASASAARGPVPTAQRTVPAGSTSWSIPSPGPTRSPSATTTAAAVPLDPVGSIDRAEAALPSWSSSSVSAQAAGESAHRAFDAMPEGIGGAPGLPLTPLQRTMSASPAPVAELAPMGQGAAEMSPMVQRRLDAPMPVATSSPAQPSGSGMSEVSEVSGVSGRTVGLAEMFALASAQADAATVQRAAEDSTPSPAETEIQREPAPTSSPSTTPSAPPAGAPGAAAPSGAELDEMARRLYEPLTARLRAELWQDRERSGLLTDLRP